MENAHFPPTPNTRDRIVEQVTQKSSSNSKFSVHEKRKRDKNSEKCEQIRREITERQSSLVSLHSVNVEKFISSCREYSQCILFRRVYVHFDMDAFFATVEARDNPSLNHVPFAVGGNSMLSTANYIARQYGVKSAMPGRIARKICPDLVIIPCNMQKYQQTSQIVMSILREYDPKMISFSIDEASVCLNAALFDASKQRKHQICSFVHRIRMRILEESGASCSAGIAYTRKFAKLCSDMNKPNGQYYLEPDIVTIQKILSTRSAGDISGVGKVSQQILLEAFDIRTCDDIVQKRHILAAFYGGDSWKSMVSFSMGLAVPPASLLSGDNSLNCNISNWISSKYADANYDEAGDELEEYSELPQSINTSRTFSASNDLAHLIQKPLREICQTLVSSITAHIACPPSRNQCLIDSIIFPCVIRDGCVLYCR